MERAGIAEALRRSGSLEPLRPVAPRASSTPARPVGPPRFELGARTFLGKHRVSEDEIVPLLQRHASGDWGESRYADDNEAAVASGRPILSVFRAANGQQVLLIAFSQPPRTTVWVQSGIDYPEEGLLDLVCQHVGTGRRAEARYPGAASPRHPVRSRSARPTRRRALGDPGRQLGRAHGDQLLAPF